MSIIEYLFNFLAPHHCLSCNKEGFVLCPECTKTLPAPEFRCYSCQVFTDESLICKECSKRGFLHAVMAATIYDNAAKEAVHLLKFKRVQAVAKDMAGVMAARIGRIRPDCVTYVPTAPSRLRARGYDQAALLARELARSAALPRYSFLNRWGKQRQIGQSRAVRRKQMLGAFYAVNLKNIQSKHVLVVDDVFTTGATCEEVARILLQAGAARVSVIAFALAERQQNKKPPRRAEQ